MLQVTAEESQAAFNELLSTDEVVRLKFTNALLLKRVAALEAALDQVDTNGAREEPVPDIVSAKG
tara:strand:- start:2196 stop:2390 length:195 start_codon:yes stop_codon:yes gene_type:complete